MQQFNLVVSTARDFEIQAETELWFNLCALGDENPIIFQSGFQGLVLVKTKLKPRSVIAHLADIHQNRDPKYIQFIQKIFPIDLVVPTELPAIESAVAELIRDHPLYLDPHAKFRITIRKRNSPLKTEDIIATVAPLISRPVDLKHFDWNVQFEIFGKNTGIAIITPNDVFRPLQTTKSAEKTILEEEINDS